MPVKVGINGFGRIGRNIFRAALGDPDIEIVAVNDITDSKTLAHLLKYDSILGNLYESGDLHTTTRYRWMAKASRFSGPRIPRIWTGLRWALRSWLNPPGLFTKGSDARKHIRGPVKKVIISAPATDPDAHFRSRRKRKDV